MKFKAKSFGIICLASLCILTGCKAKVVGHRILGRWEHDGNVIEFRNDGYMVKGTEKYEYSVTNDRVTIDENGEAMILDYSFNSNGTLTMNGIIYYPASK